MLDFYRTLRTAPVMTDELSFDECQFLVCFFSDQNVELTPKSVLLALGLRNLIIT